MRSRAILVAVALSVGAGSMPALAHHSFSAEFDDKNCGEFTGTLTAIDWQNPHAYFYLEAKDASGAAQKLTFQTSSLANMIRGGTPRAYFMKNMGKTLIARACASLNGTDHRYAASWVRVPDEEIHRVGQDVEGAFGTNN